MSEQLQPDYYYLPSTCPSRGGVHAGLAQRCRLCGWDPPAGLVGLEELMELGDAQLYEPKHRRSVFSDRWRWQWRRRHG